jgi:hypothetical protein
MLDICRVKQKRIAKKSRAIPRFDIIGTKIGTRINIRGRGCGTLAADTENIDDNKGRIVWRCLNGEAL